MLNIAARVGVRRRVLPARPVAALPLPDRPTALPPLALGRGCRDRRLRRRRALRPAGARTGRRGRARVGRQPDRARRRARADRRPRDDRDGAARRRHRGRAGRVRHPLGALPRSAPAADGVVHDRGGGPGDRPGFGHQRQVGHARGAVGAGHLRHLLFGIGWPLLGPLGSRAEAAEHLTWARSEPEPEPRSSSVGGPTLDT